MKITNLAWADIDWLRRLRNSEREHFFDSRYITPTKQDKWFLALPKSHKVYIIWDKGERVGTFSIVPPPEDLPVPGSVKPVLYFSTFIIPKEHRGKGILEVAKKKFSHVYNYVGYIREENEVSLRAFIKFGMQPLYVTDTSYGPVWVMFYDTNI